MKLYGFGPMRSLRALWGLKELDTDFEFVHVRRKRRVYLRAADLRDRQRLGRPPSVNGAPTFVLTHKPPQTIRVDPLISPSSEDLSPDRQSQQRRRGQKLRLRLLRIGSRGELMKRYYESCLPHCEGSSDPGSFGIQTRCPQNRCVSACNLGSDLF